MRLGVLAQPDLARAMHAISPVVGRGHLPVMSSVRIEARGDEIVVTASSNDATIRHVTPAREAAVGVAVVPARPLQRFVASVSDAVTLELHDDALTVSSGRARLELRAVDVAAWHAVSEPVGTRTVWDDGDTARVARILHAAAAPGGHNPALATAQLHDGWAVALDGYRLAAAQVNPASPSCLVPIEVIAAAIAGGGEVEIGADEHRVMLTSASTTCVATTIPGTPHDWRSLLPAKESRTERLTADRLSLLEAIRRAEALRFSDVGINYTRVDLQPAGADTLLVKSTDPTVGETIEEVAGTMSLPHLSFNAQYFRQALENASEEVVEFRMAEASRPAVLDEENVLQLVMPVRIPVSR